MDSQGKKKRDLSDFTCQTHRESTHTCDLHHHSPLLFRGLQHPVPSPMVTSPAEHQNSAPQAFSTGSPFHSAEQKALHERSVRSDMAWPLDPFRTVSLLLPSLTPGLHQPPRRSWDTPGTPLKASALASLASDHPSPWQSCFLLRVCATQGGLTYSSQPAPRSPEYCASLDMP